MSWRLLVRPAAEKDLADAFDWYEGQQHGLGGEFLRYINERLSRIVLRPEQYALYYKHYRRLHVKKFHYNILFRIIGKDVFIVRILHSARDHRSLLD